MARDLKLSSWTWTTVTRSTSAMGVDATTATAPVITLGPSGAGSTYRAVSDAKNVMGFINSKLNSSTLADFLAGNEISSVTGQPAIWGNTSYGEMYARCAISMSAMVTGNTCLFPSSAGAYVVLEGAYDNGAATPASDGLWVPISGAIPLVTGTSALSVTVAASGNAVTTTTPHGLRVGDFVVLSSIAGLTVTTYLANQVAVVQATPSPVSFTIATVAAPTTALTITGTSSGGVVQKLISSNTNNVLTAGSIATGTKFISTPLTQSLRPWMRWALHFYDTGANVHVGKVTISQTALVLGRDNAQVG